MFAQEPLTVARLERVCRCYYYAGFAALPWLWLLLWWFARPYVAHSAAVAWYARMSLRLCVAAALLVVVWYVALLLWLPRDSRLWVIAPHTTSWQPGYFARR